MVSIAETSPPQSTSQEISLDGTAAGLVLTYLTGQLATLREHAPVVLAEDPEAVHQMRLAARRLRSALATSKKYFDADTVALLREELKWLGSTLGEFRDAQVAHERVRTLLESEPTGLVMGHASQRLDEGFEERYSSGRRSIEEALHSERYTALLADLEEFLAGPPADGNASQPAPKGTGKLLSKESRRLQRKFEEWERLANGEHVPEAQEDVPETQEDVPEAQSEHAHSRAKDVALHEIRKAAKRLRYAAEIVGQAPGKKAGGKKAKRLEKGAHRLQKILGMHQDSVVVRQLLVNLGSRASRSGENGFSYGRLHAREEATARETEADFLKAWKKFHAKELSQHL